MLTKNLTNEDIKDAVFSIAAIKLPGPDGMLAGFYQKILAHYWSLSH